MNHRSVASSVNAREELISSIKQYQIHIACTTILTLLIIIFFTPFFSLRTTTSSKHMASSSLNAEFIELQNPSIDKYELEYIVDEINEEKK